MSIRAFLSPLSSAILTRRASTRHDVDGVVVQVRYADTGVPVLLQDVSSGGVGILTSQAVAVGTVREFRLGHESTERLFTAQATHCHRVEPGVWLSGWEAYGTASRQLIEDVFEMLMNQPLTAVS